MLVTSNINGPIIKSWVTVTRNYLSILQITYCENSISTCLERLPLDDEPASFLLPERDPSTVCLVLMPSNNRTSKMLGGKSSTLTSTNVRHSGHLNSRFVLIISSRHLLQKVCWQGNTLLLWSSLSKHTEHSNNSFKDCSSILIL